MAGPGSLGPLGLRVATGLVLVGIALAALWLGGPVFSALAAAAGLLMFAEWAVMHRLGRAVRLAGLAIIAASVALLTFVTPGEAVMTLAAGAAVLGIFAARLASAAGAPARRGAGFAAAGGVLYCGLPVLALIWVRGLSLGLPATLFLMLCVWATDIAAFFAGRSIGGPRLAPAISPAKTWAGAIGGVAGAMLVAGGAAAAYLDSVAGHGAAQFVSLAGALAVLSVLGDLYESWLKRRAGVKDSGQLLPGHGGVLDRLDGLVPVAIAGAAVFATTGWAG